jgi:hypothetical protein
MPHRDPLLAVAALAAALVVSPAARAESGDERARPPAVRPCVDVEIAGERTPDYACLTNALRRSVDATKPIANLPPIKLGANPNALGLITPTEVRQQFGPNFGKSVVPYRPQRTYPVPLVGGQQ